jgi:hypothetical protein
MNALQPSIAEDYTLSIRPGSEFSFDKARQKILQLSQVLPYADRLSLEIPEDTLGGDGGKLLRMGGIIEWNKQVAVYTYGGRVTADYLCGCINYVSQET